MHSFFHFSRKDRRMMAWSNTEHKVLENVFTSLLKSIQEDYDLNNVSEYHHDIREKKNHGIEASHCPEDCFLNQNITNSHMQNNCTDRIHEISLLLLDKINIRRLSKERNSKHMKDHLLLLQNAFLLENKRQVQHVIRQDMAFTRKVKTQEYSACRRLQELLYECISEMTKSIIRAKARVVYHQLKKDEMVTACKSNFEWQLFASKLTQESCGNCIYTAVSTVLGIDSSQTTNDEEVQRAAIIEYKSNEGFHDIYVPNPIHDQLKTGKWFTNNQEDIYDLFRAASVLAGERTHLS